MDAAIGVYVTSSAMNGAVLVFGNFLNTTRKNNFGLYQNISQAQHYNPIYC